MSGWRASIVAAFVGGIVLLVGWLIGRSGDDGDAPPPPPTDHATLACPTALSSVCDELAEELETSAISFSPGTQQAEGVVVIAPAADLPDGLAPGPIVGRSPVVIAVWRERGLVLEGACGSIDVACVVSALGGTWTDLGGSSAWGDITLGLADPSRTEAALAAWSLLASNGAPEGLSSSLRLLATDDGSLMVEIAQFGDSRADMAMATEVAVAAQLQNVIGRGGRLEVFYPDPGPWVDFVAAGAGPGVDATITRLLESEIQGRLAGLGMRPVSGFATELPDGLGSPGEEAPPLDEAARTRLLDAWEEQR